MKIVTHKTIDAAPIKSVIEALVDRQLRRYVETIEVQYTPTRAELQPGADNLRRVMSLWDEDNRRIRVFMWPVIHWLRFHNHTDSVRYQAWEEFCYSLLRSFGSAKLSMTDPSPVGQAAFGAVQNYGKDLIMQGEFRGLLAPPANMGLIDKAISEWIRRVLNEGRGRPLSHEGRLIVFYRELTMRKLGVDHTVAKVVSRLDESAVGPSAKMVGLSNMDDNGKPWNGHHGERYEPGFIDVGDSYRTRCLTIRGLAEAMGLGRLYVDRAKRTYLYLPHADYSSLLNVMFYKGK